MKKIFIICIVLSLFFGILPAMSVTAAGVYDIEDYEKVIEQVNQQYNRNFAITDTILFEQNICNRLTVKEFKDMLTVNSSQVLPQDYNISVSIPYQQNRAIKKYSAEITHGDWNSRLNARIQTNSKPEFVEYVDAGYAWDANWTTWLFYASTIKCEEFSSSSCKVSYKGNWRIPKSGVEDLTYLTYKITYYPS